jgi:hypothetical protein
VHWNLNMVWGCGLDSTGSVLGERWALLNTVMNLQFLYKTANFQSNSQ